MQVLRFKYGQVWNLFYMQIQIGHSLDLESRIWVSWNISLCLQIYSVNVAVFLGGNKPSRSGDVRGDISVNFSCDPDISSKLVCAPKSPFWIAYIQFFYKQLDFANSEFFSGWFCSGGDIIPTGWRSFWRRCIDHPRNWTKSSWKWITGLVESVMLKLMLMYIGSHYFIFL